MIDTKNPCEVAEAKVEMLRRDFKVSEERQDRAIERLTGDTEHLKSQHRELFAQQMEHAKLLLDHGKLLVQHSEQIGVAREQTREATQRATELSRELRDSMTAVDRHVAGLAQSQADSVAKVGDQVGRLAQAQESSNEERAKDREEQKLQTAALNKLVAMTGSPRFATIFAIAVGVAVAIGTVVERHFLR